ncbi:hypothetical protein AJ81_06965 [Pseudothermotoga hypogea DSM 11164 = NBRC 106472]|uniref:Uncharacterized protein n=1 Tax=Pseudothermotoga hypogea DSM 11164 = NBRC 106472 TaxID=1123384 RepID=A0A0X1KUE3_9THEM|nr:hypothetical protein [Pseudothermotoga hypogea]AJC74812.1 hypothetical protein AJ81_06965 [Pseudothermotoga hypogea DSM 11164 = NBRC 106472]
MKRHGWIIIVLIGLGIWTLLPIPGASKPCLLGYYAHCSFTPISTIMCWIPVGILYWRKAKQSAK